MAAAWLSSNLDALDLGMIAMVYYVLAATVIIDAICVVRRLRACEEVKKEVQQDYAENEEESQQELQEGYFEACGDQPCPSYVSKSEGLCLDAFDCGCATYGPSQTGMDCG